MAKKISGSVGKGGKNKPADVEQVQTLLNAHARRAKYPRLRVDGDAGRKTIGAIRVFQTRVLGLPRGDGRVDPGKETLKGLGRRTATVAASQTPSSPRRGR